MCSYSLVHALFEAIDILLREVINADTSYRKVLYKQHIYLSFV